MSELTELQQWMADVLRSRRALTKSEAVTERAKDHFTGNDRLSPVEQVNIYREQFWLRHTTALVEDFPGLGGVIGQSDWERLVEDYFDRYPPISWTLRNLGDRLPEHVEASTWLPHHELCVDMARLEWLYVEVFDAAEAPPLDPSKLATIPEEAWASATIVVHPALRLLRTRYAVAELRRRLRAKPEQSIAIPDPDAQNVVLYRGASRNLEYDVVGDGAYELLEALREGLPLVSAAERAGSRAPGEVKAIEVSVGAWFEQWGKRGWIVDVEV